MVNIISFAWTSAAFKAHRKTVTRRQWSDKYASRFHLWDLCKAYDKQPRFGGKQIGIIQLLNITFEDIADMPDSDFEAEGFKYMEEQGLKIWGLEPREAFNKWKADGGYYWVIRFKNFVNCPICKRKIPEER